MQTDPPCASTRESDDLRAWAASIEADAEWESREYSLFPSARGLDGRVVLKPLCLHPRAGPDEQTGEAATLPAVRIFPLFRYRSLIAVADGDQDFELHQLELLWQTGLLGGLSLQADADDPLPEAVLAWAEQRQVLIVWGVRRTEHLRPAERSMLEPYTFPVILRHSGRLSAPSWCAQAIEMLSRYRHLYLAANSDWPEVSVHRAIQEFPDRVLLDFERSGADRKAAGPGHLLSELPDRHRALLLGENLRSLIDHVRRHRGRLLQQPASLLFPRLPGSEEDLVRQGFKWIGRDELPPAEPHSARCFWSSQGQVSFYEGNQPWRRRVADLAKDLEAESILEFGCNVGQNLAAIRRVLPAARLAGIDINAEAVRLGREKTGLDLRVGDESALETLRENEFDLVFTVSVLDHVANVEHVCRQLVRAARRYLYLLEVRLPAEGKIIEHYDHKHRSVRASTGASYSWHLERILRAEPRVRRLHQRPVYLHSASLGPYYTEYLALLDPHESHRRLTTQ